MTPMSMYLAEFVGTALLLWLGNGINMTCSLKHSYGKGAGWVATCLAWGFAVMLSAYTVGWVSGAHLNPALTIGLAVGGAFSWSLVPGYIVAQIAGGVLGATLAYITYKVQMDEEPDAGTKLGVFATGPSIDAPVWNVVTEIMGTIILVVGIVAFGNAGVGAGYSPIVVGLLIALVGFATGGATGFAINPARDLGPRIAHAILPIKGKGGSNWKYAWIPIVGPVIGAIIGVTLFNAFVSMVS